MFKIQQHRLGRLFGQLRSADWVLVLSVFTLLILGLAAIYSVELSHEVATFVRLKKQLIAISAGVTVFLVIALSNYKSLQNYSFIFYLFCISLLIAVLVFGNTIRGSTGWFVMGPVSFQPVEFMKVGLVIALSTYFSKRSRGSFGLRTFFESLFITFVPIFFVMMQPDFGSASILLGIWLLFTLYAGISWRYIFAMAGFGVVMFMLSWSFFFADYQKARIMTFLDPSVDPLGQGYNVTQAIIAVGSGGFFGSGLGFGTQSQLKFLPESQTDFIFAVIAEELGFFGVSVLLLAFFFCFYRLWRHAFRAQDDFTAYLALGVGSVLFLQFLVNVGMNLGLFPVTGIGLPFVSYGGSSIVVMFVLLAIVQSIAIRGRGSRD
jgi:rod shape determining protein RodA